MILNNKIRMGALKLHLLGVRYKNYRVFKNEFVQLSSKYKVCVEDDFDIVEIEEYHSGHKTAKKQLTIKKIDIKTVNNVFENDDISYKCIVGKNGSGKSTILSNDYNWSYKQGSFDDNYINEIFYRIYLDEFNNKIYICHPVGNNHKNNIHDNIDCTIDGIKVDSGIKFLTENEHKSLVEDYEFNYNHKTAVKNTIINDIKILKDYLKIKDKDIAVNISKFSEIKKLNENKGNYNFEIIKELVLELNNSYQENHKELLKLYLLILFDEYGNNTFFNEQYCKQHIEVLYTKEFVINNLQTKKKYKINKNYLEGKNLDENSIQYKIFKEIENNETISRHKIDDDGEQNIAYNKIFDKVARTYEESNLYRTLFKELIVVEEIKSKEELEKQLKNIELDKLINEKYRNSFEIIYEKFYKIIFNNYVGKTIHIRAVSIGGADIHFCEREIIYCINNEEKKLIEVMEKLIEDIYDLTNECKILSHIFKCELCNMSSGQREAIKLLSNIDIMIKNRLLGLYVGNINNPKIYNMLLTIDEPDLHLHPEWSRRFKFMLHKVIEKVIEEAKEEGKILKVQVILTTHSPFIVSDFKNNELVMLNFEENGYTSRVQETDKSFYGANIYDILNDSFFLESGIGEFARREINEKIKFLKNIINQNKKLDEEQKTNMNKFKDCIADRYIKDYFSSLLGRCL